MARLKHGIPCTYCRYHRSLIDGNFTLPTTPSSFPGFLRMKKLLLGLAGLLVLALAYLLLWPNPIQPVAWTPPPPVPLTGIYAPNSLLKDTQRLAVGVGEGPEGIAVDAVGRVYAGYADGRIVTITANGSSYQELATSKKGRPMGITFGPNGGLVIADAEKGLLAVGSTKTPRTLITEADGKAFALADDVDNTRLDKNLYFSDASQWPLKHVLWDFIEHKGTGRLIQYNATTGDTKVLMQGLQFANGVAVGPDDAFVLVTETGAYRIHRYWLKGEKAGTHEVFTDNLPGLPDNISYDYDNNIFWLALYSPRPAELEALANKPAWIKKMVARLPLWAQPLPPKKAWVLGLSPDGKVLHNLQYEGADAFAPITSVEAWGPWLYFGSLHENSIARFPLNKVLSGAPQPPPGWEQAPSKPHHFKPPVTEEEEREREQQEEQERGQPTAPQPPTPAPAAAPAPAAPAPAATPPG